MRNFKVGAAQDGLGEGRQLLEYTKVTARVSLPYAGKWYIRACHAADALNAATYSSYRT